MKKKKGYIVLAGIIAFFVLFNILLHFYSPEDIVHLVGVENTYILIFSVATIGGLSTLTGVTLFTSIVTFVAGGADPLFLALASGAGIFISDTVFYFLAFYGRKSVPESWEKNIERVKRHAKKYPSWVVLTGTYIYIGMTPLPNDFLMVALVVAGYSYKKIVWVLLAGSFTIGLFTAYLAYFLLG